MSEKNPFAGDVKPSMQRRSQWADYRGRRMYMVTMVIEGRRPLLGEVVGDVTAPEGSASAPRTIPSPLGVRVQENFYAIAQRYAQVEVLACQLMPDHLHGILFVHEQTAHHLGQMISGFKAGCNKDYRALVLGQGVRSAVALPRPTENGQPEAVEPPATDVRPRPPREAYDREHGLLFASGYNDRLLLRAGQLERWLHYLADNPRRLLMKRQCPDWLRPHFHVNVGGNTFSAIGNRDLLSAPQRVQVRVSRRCTPTQVQEEVARYLALARRGAVLVSPAISPGEKAVMRAAFNEGLPLIVLVENGFTPLSKPSGEQFDACAAGQLLMLAPWEHHNDRRKITAAQCQSLNLMAHALCAENPSRL